MHQLFDDFHFLPICREAPYLVYSDSNTDYKSSEPLKTLVML